MAINYNSQGQSSGSYWRPGVGPHWSPGETIISQADINTWNRPEMIAGGHISSLGPARPGYTPPIGNQGQSSGRTAPNAPPPVQARNYGNQGNMTPFNPVMSRQNYFQGIPPWSSGQSSLSSQNPWMSMGNQQGGWGGQLQAQNPMMTMGIQPYAQSIQNIPSSRATSNPYMPSFQQNQPQQQPTNPYSPYRNDWGWAQQSPFAGLRYPAY